MVVTFNLPRDRNEAYTLELYQNGKAVLEPTPITVGVFKIDVMLTGSGIQSYDLYINGKFYKTEEVDFTVNG